LIVAHGPEDGDSVFDFIYVDRPRIDLYLAQFSEFGNLTTLVRSVRESDTKQVGLNAHVIRGEKKSGQETGIEKHYDAQWIAPLIFLDEVQNRQMLKPNMGNARIGDLVILRPARLTSSTCARFRNRLMSCLERLRASLQAGSTEKSGAREALSRRHPQVIQPLG
jgi:hypothetical protein